MSLSLHAIRHSGGRAFLLVLFLLTSFVFVVSPVHAASSKASTAHQRTPHVGNSVAPVRTSTMTASHQVSGSPSRQPIQPAPLASSRPAPSSGATVLKPSAQASGGLHPNTAMAAPSFPGQQGPIYGQQDPSAAAGRYNIMEVAHPSFTIYDRSGNLQYSNDLNAWFGVSGGGPQLWNGDVLFDLWNERFAFIATDNYTNLSIAVAQQTNALGSYCNYTFSLANYGSLSLNTVVYPQAVGFDETYLYYTGVVQHSGSSSYSFIFQINLKQMESCSSVSSWTWDHMTDASGQPALGIVPAMKYNFNVAHDEEYLISPILSGGCSITLWRINNHVLSSNAVNTECYSPTGLAVQPGEPANLPTATSGMLFHQATFSFGLLDFAMATGYNWGGGNVTSAIAWLKIDPVAATVSQQGYIGASGYWYFNPAMTQDSNNNSVIVFDVSSSSVFPSVWYVGQNADGNLQDMFSLVTSAPSNTPSLGDYLSARIDPVDQVHIWICGSYGRGTSGWGSQIAQTAAI